MTGNNFLTAFLSEKPLFRKPLMSADSAGSSNQPVSATKTIPATPYVRRRFPRLREAGGRITVLDRTIFTRKITSPISRLESVLKARADSGMPKFDKEIQLMPLSLWKPIAAGGHTFH